MKTVIFIYRRGLLGQPGAGWLGGHPPVRGECPGAVRGRGADHQQPHGDHGGTGGAAGPSGGPCAVELYSDSQYVVNALNNGWLRDWKRRAGAAGMGS